MNKHQDNKLKMYQAVEGFLEEKITIISTIPEMPVTLNLFKGLIQQMISKFKVTKNALTGTLKDKYNSESKVIDYTVAVAAGIFAYGSKIKNNELIEIGSISRSGLEKYREVQLVPVVESILEKAEMLSSELSSYGITNEILESLSQYIDLHKDSLSKRKTFMGVRVGATDSIKDLMIETDLMLEVLDKFTEIIRLNNKDFYTEYNSVRTVKNLGESHKEKLPESEPVAQKVVEGNNS